LTLKEIVAQFPLLLETLTSTTPQIQDAEVLPFPQRETNKLPSLSGEGLVNGEFFE
jgi:hypothetical protein